MANLLRKAIFNCIFFIVLYLFKVESSRKSIFSPAESDVSFVVADKTLHGPDRHLRAGGGPGGGGGAPGPAADGARRRRHGRRARHAVHAPPAPGARARPRRASRAPRAARLPRVSSPYRSCELNDIQLKGPSAVTIGAVTRMDILVTAPTVMD